MRWLLIGFAVGLLSLPLAVARAEDRRETGDRVLEGVITGLLGTPQQSPNAAYTAQERERLVSLLQSGEYATSRQGETIDLMVFGVPLTRVEHVYTAKPIRPSQTSSGQGSSP